MRTIQAGEFKAKCLRLMDEVAETGEPLLITKHGRPVARLVPAGRRPATLYGALAGTLTITGDLIEPVGEPWDAER